MKFFILFMATVAIFGQQVFGKPMVRLSEVQGKSVDEIINLGALGVLGPMATQFQPVVSNLAKRQITYSPYVARPVVYNAAPKPVTLVAQAPQQIQYVAPAPKPVVFAAPKPVVYAAPAPQPVRYVAPQPLAALEEEIYPPTPFTFSFDNVDEFGTRMARQESGDGAGTVKGTYSYMDYNGMARVVNYVADHNGFRAEIQTNEPGTETSNPADAVIISSSPPVHKK